MEFYLPLHTFPDASVKPLVIKSLNFNTIQRCIDLLPQLVKQDLMTLQNGGSVPSTTRPFLVLNADFPAILSYSQYRNNCKMFAVDPKCDLYTLDVNIVGDCTTYDDIARALQFRAAFVPKALKDWLTNPWPRALVVSGKRATEALRANMPSCYVYETSIFAMVGISGNFDPPQHTQIVNVQAGTLSEVATFWNGLLQYVTNRQRKWYMVVSVGDSPRSLPARMLGTAVLLTDADFGAPAVQPLPKIAFPSAFAESLFAQPYKKNVACGDFRVDLRNFGNATGVDT